MKALSTDTDPWDRAPEVVNALLRCTRNDNRAAPLFEQLDKVPGMWVFELGPSFGKTSWSEWLSEAHHMLAANEAFLQALREGSTDYTLHLTVAFSEYSVVKIPPTLSLILGACGVTVELYHSTDD